ncbi:hypothetical protein Tco_0810917 [Tanacetum coccineum]
MDNYHSIGTPLTTKPKLDVDLSGELVDQSDTNWGDCGVSSESFSLLVDLNIKYTKYSLAEDSSASVLQALRRSSSIFTSVYVAAQKLKKALARASVQLGWQYHVERCQSPLRS